MQSLDRRHSARKPISLDRIHRRRRWSLDCALPRGVAPESGPVRTRWTGGRSTSSAGEHRLGTQGPQRPPRSRCTLPESLGARARQHHAPRGPTPVTKSRIAAGPDRLAVSRCGTQPPEQSRKDIEQGIRRKVAQTSSQTSELALQERFLVVETADCARELINSVRSSVCAACHREGRAAASHGYWRAGTYSETRHSTFTDSIILLYETGVQHIDLTLIIRSPMAHVSVTLNTHSW
jgi:hypothetical protein